MAQQHVDNCTRQNKNNAMIKLVSYNRLACTNKSPFFLVGHTTFSPDWCFGLFKEYLVSQKLVPSKIFYRL